MAAAYGPTVQPKPDPSGKYPFVGPHYAGEIPGYIYFPWDDKYHPDTHAVADFNQAHGGAPPLPGGEVRQGPDGKTYQLGPDNKWVDITPKKPGVIEQAAPLAVAGGGYALGQTLGTQFGQGHLPTFGLGTPKPTPTPTPSLPTPGAGTPTPATPSTPSFGLSPETSAVPGALPEAGGAGQVTAAGSDISSGAAQAFSGEGSIGGSGWLGTTGANPTVMGSTTAGSFLPSLGYVAGAYTGMQQGKGLYEAYKGDKMGWKEQAALALPTFGLSLGYNTARDLFGFGNKHHWQDEKNDLNDLAKKGTFIPQNLLDSMPNKAQGKHAGFVDSLAPDFVGANPSGGAWVNNKFAQSRNVADLQPTDIVNYATFAEHDPDWFNKPLDQRLQIAQQALDAKAVSEGHGQVKVDWNKFKPLPAENQGKPAESVSASGPGPMPKGPQGNTTLAPRDNMGTPGRRPKKR